MFIVDVDGVLIADELGIERFDLDRGDDRIGVRPDRAGMDIREVSDVAEVVDHAGGRHLPRLDARRDAAERRVGVLRNLGWPTGRCPGAQPDESVVLAHLQQRQVGC